MVGQEFPRGTRRASALPIVMGLLVLLAFLMAQLFQVTRGEARLSRTHEMDAEHLYRAEGVLSRFLNRLKKRPWVVRYYAEGGPGRGPFSARHSGEYRDCRYLAWVQDVSLGDVPAVPGLVDLFLRVEYEELQRSFQYRVSVLPRSLRRRRGVRIESFSRVAGDVDDPGTRLELARAATEEMRRTAENRLASEQILAQLPVALQQTLAGGRSDLAGADSGLDPDLLVAEVMLGGGAVASERVAARKQLRRGIHLMGTAGESLQDFLEPLERGRFEYRDPNFGAARVALEEAVRLSEGELRPHVMASLALARAYSAQAWRLGPASRVGRELLERAWRALQAALRALEGGGDREQAHLGPTLGVSIYVDLIQVGLMMGDRQQTVDRLLGDAAEHTLGVGVYGGSVNPDELIMAVVESMDTPEARARIASRHPLPPSGLTRVHPDEVEVILDDLQAGWQRYPTDSGMDQGWFDDMWVDLVGRQGEGGTGEATGNVDRDGDGVVDVDAALGPTDIEEIERPDPPAGKEDVAEVIDAAEETAKTLDEAAKEAAAEAEAKEAMADVLEEQGLLAEAEELREEARAAKEVAGNAQAAADEARELVEAARDALDTDDPLVAALASNLSSEVAGLAARAAVGSGAASDAFEAASKSADAVRKVVEGKGDFDETAVTRDLADLQAARDAAQVASEAATRAARISDSYSGAAEMAASVPPDLAGALASYAEAQAARLPADPTPEELETVGLFQGAAERAADGDLESALATFEEAEKSREIAKAKREAIEEGRIWEPPASAEEAAVDEAADRADESVADLIEDAASEATDEGEGDPGEETAEGGGGSGGEETSEEGGGSGGEETPDDGGGSGGEETPD